MKADRSAPQPASEPAPIWRRQGGFCVERKRSNPKLGPPNGSLAAIARPEASRRSGGGSWARTATSCGSAREAKASVPPTPGIIKDAERLLSRRYRIRGQDIADLIGQALLDFISAKKSAPPKHDGLFPVIARRRACDYWRRWRTFPSWAWRNSPAGPWQSLVVRAVWTGYFRQTTPRSVPMRPRKQLHMAPSTTTPQHSRRRLPESCERPAARTLLSEFIGRRLHNATFGNSCRRLNRPVSETRKERA